MDYASIINGNQLQINPYYCTNSNEIGPEGNRKITITISCGGFSTAREISIFPLKATYTFTYNEDTQVFKSSFNDLKANTGISATSESILLPKDKNTFNDYDTIASWLDGENKTFIPKT